MRKIGFASVNGSQSSFDRIEDEIGTLKNSIGFARRAIDGFYETQIFMKSD